MMVRPLVAAAALLCVGGCSRAKPAPPAPFLVGRCPGYAAVPDSTNVVVVKRVRIAPPYFHPLHTIALGDIVARLTVDTLGRPEEGSVVILESTHPSLSASICQDLLEQNFEAAMVEGRPRRTRGDFEAHFRAAQAPKREGQ